MFLLKNWFKSEQDKNIIGIKKIKHHYKKTNKYFNEKYRLI